jgi:hypothetical protein
MYVKCLFTVPAYENKGEGIFLQFSAKAIREWHESSGATKRAESLARGFTEWRKEHSGSGREFPNLAYLMLHSLSHLLITTVALGCGYPASSIRERIYAIPGVGYGILLYTGSSDSEGTLGGLVQLGRRIHETVKAALDLGTLCSNDPVCAQHDPASGHESRFLHTFNGSSVTIKIRFCLRMRAWRRKLHGLLVIRSLFLEFRSRLAPQYWKLVGFGTWCRKMSLNHHAHHGQ